MGKARAQQVVFHNGREKLDIRDKDLRWSCVGQAIDLPTICSTPCACQERQDARAITVTRAIDALQAQSDMGRGRCFKMSFLGVCCQIHILESRLLLDKQSASNLPRLMMPAAPKGACSRKTCDSSDNHSAASAGQRSRLPLLPQLRPWIKQEGLARAALPFAVEGPKITER